MKLFTITELSKEMDVQIFMLIEFLNSNGMQLEVKGFFVSSKVPEPLYNKALEQKFKIKELESLRKEELAFKIKYLTERVKTIEIISFGPDVALEEKYETALNELSKAESELFLRGNIMEEMDVDLEDNSDDDYRVSESYHFEDSNVKEYNIYNSFGWVTSTTNFAEARAMSLQFGGRIIDENGKIV